MNLNSVVPDRGEPTMIGIGGRWEATDFGVPLDLRSCDQKRDMSRVNNISSDVKLTYSGTLNGLTIYFAQSFVRRLRRGQRRYILERLSANAEWAIFWQPHLIVVADDRLNRHPAL